MISLIRGLFKKEVFYYFDYTRDIFIKDYGFKECELLKQSIIDEGAYILNGTE